MDLNQQSDLFSFLGDSLNENIFKVTTDNFKNAKDLYIEELKLANKKEFYSKCDNRLKSFIEWLTARKVYSNECINFKYNAYENLLKARNSKFVSEIGLKEHMVTYLSSGKARHTTQVFSKQGGKG